MTLAAPADPAAVNVKPNMDARRGSGGVSLAPPRAPDPWAAATAPRGRDVLRSPGSAARARPHVEVEDALEQARPADAVRQRLEDLDLTLGGASGTSAASRCLNSSGLIARGVASPCHGVWSFSSTCPALSSCTRWSDGAGPVVQRQTLPAMPPAFRARFRGAVPAHQALLPSRLPTARGALQRQLRRQRRRGRPALQALVVPVVLVHAQASMRAAVLALQCCTNLGHRPSFVRVGVEVVDAGVRQQTQQRRGRVVQVAASPTCQPRRTTLAEGHSVSTASSEAIFMGP